MMTILPQNSILSRANTVTVDAEKFAKLNGITDEQLRQALGKAFAKLVNSYDKNILSVQTYTVGQALEVVEMLAKEIRDFTGVQTSAYYDPKTFPPEEDGTVETPDTFGVEQEGVRKEESQEKPAITVNDRKKMLFNSFNRRR